jgi:hypothetical protein
VRDLPQAQKGISEKISYSPEELIAVVSDFDAVKDMHVFLRKTLKKLPIS